MAVKIEFQGFVNDVKHFDWGTVYNVSHSQRQKDEQGEWQTTGYDYFDVVDNTKQTQLAKGDRINVEGKMKTRRYEGKDGVQRLTLQVRADSIERVRGRYGKGEEHDSETVGGVASVDVADGAVDSGGD